MIYELKIKKYVPFYKVKEKGKKECFNEKRDRIKKKRDRAWI